MPASAALDAASAVAKIASLPSTIANPHRTEKLLLKPASSCKCSSTRLVDANRPPASSAPSPTTRINMPKEHHPHKPRPVRAATSPPAGPVVAAAGATDSWIEESPLQAGWASRSNPRTYPLEPTEVFCRHRPTGNRPPLSTISHRGILPPPSFPSLRNQERAGQSTERSTVPGIYQ